MSAILTQGTTLGRYQILERLGEGAMGAVYAARDPDLSRRVALKVLHAGVERSGERRALLLREAQAAARLQHENVVAVFDVGVHDGEVFMAMELCEGGTLAEWLRQPRGFDEVRALFVPAARGLAAAHEAGLVHRDFKPSNVLLGKDGRARVTDFGLALPLPEAPDGDRTSDRAGHAGTPAYMSPEQHRGHAADARSDQWSFCVALHEALYGAHPFTGERVEGDDLSTKTALALDAVSGRVRAPPPGARVPAWLRKVVLRGLEPDPDRRYPSMKALLADLTHDPGASRRRWLAAIAAVAVLTATGVSVRLAAVPGPCRGADARLAGVWDAAVKAQVRAAFAGTGRPYAEDTYWRVERALDDRARAWAAMYTDSCQATQVRGEQSTALLDLRTACLDQRRREVTALTALLARAPDGEVLDRAVAASIALPSLDGCADTRALEASIPEPAGPGAHARVASLRARVAEVRALSDVGKYREGVARALPLVEEARAAGFAPIEAEALAVLGSVQKDAHDSRAAEATLREATRAAALAKDDALAADAWTNLIQVIGFQEARFTDALALQLAAEGAVDRAGGDVMAGARLLGTLGAVLQEQGKSAESAETTKRALAAAEKAVGPDHPYTATLLSNLGNAQVSLERFDEAEEAYARALAVREKVLGPDHPDVALTLNNWAQALTARGKPREAVRYLERAIAIQEKALGPDDPLLAASFNNLGSAYNALGDPAAATKALERYLAITERALGPEHPDVGRAVNNLGVVLETQGRLGEAARSYERALAIREKALGPDHRAVASTLGNLGRVLVAEHELARGVPLLERALALKEKTVGPASLAVAGALTDLAVAELESNRAEPALAATERALAIYAEKGKDADPANLAEARFAAARALWETGRDRRRARGLAVEARDVLEKEAGTVAYTLHLLARVKAWLAERAAR